MSGLEVGAGGATFAVLPGRALFWQARRMLIVADLHIGKAAAFRARGVPVPHGTTTGNLERQSRLIEGNVREPGDRLIAIADNGLFEIPAVLAA